MANLKSLHNTLNFFEGSAALFALLGILGFTTIIAFGLNPKVDTNLDNTNKVAGAQTGFLSIENAFPSNNIQIINDNQKKIFLIDFKSIVEGDQLFNLANITNANSSNQVLNISTSFEGYTEGLKVLAVDGNTEYEIDTYSGKYLNINSFETRNLKLKLSSEQNINSPVTIKIVFEY